MKNSGKKFEQQFINSVPEYCFAHRLKDPPHSFNTNIQGIRFSWDNPCDYFVFSNKHRIMFAFELKSTKYTSISFEDIRLGNDQPKKMIHKHQIEDLIEINADNEYVVGGFIFNFRNEDNGVEVCFYQNATDFWNMAVALGKKSFNAIDLIKSGTAIKIEGQKKRVNYIWDIDTLLKQISQQIDKS